MAREIPVVPSASPGSAGEVSAAASCRVYRPVIADPKSIDPKVVLFCPDGALTLEDEQVILNLKYCKGCGICAKESESINMVPEYTGPQGILKAKGWVG
jgi:pyruvate ferredoxin oxidoreductase delta subunit